MESASIVTASVEIRRKIKRAMFNPQFGVRQRDWGGRGFRSHCRGNHREIEPGQACQTLRF
jgi:hypothetical protein